MKLRDTGSTVHEAVRKALLEHDGYGSATIAAVMTL
jgi:hypothetical protein